MAFFDIIATVLLAIYLNAFVDSTIHSWLVNGLVVD